MTTTKINLKDHTGERGNVSIRFLSFPFILLIPSLLLICIIQLYPVITGFSYSLQDGSLLKPGSFIGLDNYADLGTLADFWRSLKFSTYFAVFSVAGSYLIGLGLALLLNQHVPGRRLFRAFLLIPWILPSIVSIISWRWLLTDTKRLINVTLGALGIDPIYFLSTENWAIASVITVKIWRSYPFMMISLLAALQAIPSEEYESAAIDGANAWAMFRYITFPHIRNLSIVLWILMTIWSVNDFDTPWLLTQGGPSSATENLIMLAYRFVFGRNDVGHGSTIAIVSLILLMVLAVMLIRQQREVYEGED